MPEIWFLVSDQKKYIYKKHKKYRKANTVDKYAIGNILNFFEPFVVCLASMFAKSAEIPLHLLYKHSLCVSKNAEIDACFESSENTNKFISAVKDRNYLDLIF